MMRKLFWAVFLVLALTGSAQVETYAFTFGGKPYEIIKSKKSWEQASADAVSRGGYLVEIDNPAENQAIFDNIVKKAKISTRYTSVRNGGGIAYVWIGATDKVSEGKWVWDGNNDGKGKQFWSGKHNGKPQGGAYNNWGGTTAGAKKEPDNYGSGQDCAAMGLTGWPSGSNRLGRAGEWNDILSSSKIYYVVEYNRRAGVDEEQKSQYNLYPNPCADRVTVQGVNIEEVSLIDQTGKQLKTSNSTSLDVSAVAPGLYFVVIRSGNRRAVEKLIVQ